MTDTETRLRDYLRSKAATIPDEPPPLVLPSRPHRHWPVVVAAAAIAAVLVIAIPVALHLSGKDKTAPPANKPDTGLKVPYVLDDGKTRTLHDGKLTLAWPDSLTMPLGRVNGGWLTTQDGAAKDVAGAFKNGVVTPDGHFRQIGPTGADLNLLSPDKSQVVMSQQLPHKQSRVGVYDVASGREVAALNLPYELTAFWAWNQAGIWLGEDYKVGAQPLLWKPGHGQPVQLSIPGFDLSLKGASETDKIQIITRTNKGESWCMKLGSVRGTSFVVDRQYCGTGGRSFYPNVSPDGRTMVRSDQFQISKNTAMKRVAPPVAIDVATGKVTELRVPQELPDLPGPVFEDSTHLVFVDRGSTLNPTRPSVGPDGHPAIETRPVIRCDVTSGDCSEVLTPPANTRISLGHP